ncbi:MAG: ComEC/Rec2 family competence protein [Candidatus Hydrogenedentota bacterium]
MVEEDRFARFRAKQEKKQRKSIFSLENVITYIFLLIAIGIWFFAFPLIVDKIKPDFQNISANASFNDNIMEIIMFDVGQGDAFLIKTPSGKFALIDGGSGKTTLDNYKGSDAGNRVILPYLNNKAVTSLDWVVMTHPDFDHCGGLIDVLNNIKVKEFIDPCIQDPSPFYEELLTIIKEKNISYIKAREGDILAWDPSIVVQVLSAEHPLEMGNNNSSIVLRIAFGKISCLFPGDAEYEIEKELLTKYGDQLKSQILKVGHHGSKSSSSLSFIRTVRPEIALISVGVNNNYGHPDEQVLYRLKNIKSKIYRTDIDGTVVIKINGEKYNVTTEK